MLFADPEREEISGPWAFIVEPGICLGTTQADSSSEGGGDGVQTPDDKHKANGTSTRGAGADPLDGSKVGWVLQLHRAERV